MIKSCCILSMCKLAHKIMVMIIILSIIINITIIRSCVLLSKWIVELLNLRNLRLDLIHLVRKNDKI